MEKLVPSTMGTKVYIEIVKKLREMIEVDGLKPGDKIPSERELSERLNAGRSSVREALRAIELLGLIETRRGEGTYIRDFKGHQLVEILSGFILQDEKAKIDVIETKLLIELDCFRLIVQKGSMEKLLELKDWVESHNINENEFIQKIVELANNHLLYRLWVILKDYDGFLASYKGSFSREDYLNIISRLLQKDEAGVISLYRELKKMSNH